MLLFVLNVNSISCLPFAQLVCAPELVLFACCSRILLIRHYFYMCILYCCEGRKLDNSLGYYVTFVKYRILYCIVLYCTIEPR